MVMKAADCNCENDINVEIVFLATINRLSFTDKRPVCWDAYGDVCGPVCGERIALWVMKATAALLAHVALPHRSACYVTQTTVHCDLL